MIDLSKLEEIKDTITNVANAISMVLNVDVVIVDDKGNFIAAQENYIKRMGEFQFKKFSSLVCTAGEALMIQNPGNHLFCKGCPNEVNCPQLLEMIVPLKYYGTVVGIISIICFSEKQVEEIKRRKKKYLCFLEQMSQLIISALDQKHIHSKLNITNCELLSTINAVEEGILTCNEEGIILRCNKKAELLLGLSGKEIIGKAVRRIIKDCYTVNKVLNEHKNSNEMEWANNINGVYRRLIVSGKLMKNSKDEVEGALFVLRDIRNVHRLINNLNTNTINYELEDIIGISKERNKLIQNIRMVSKSGSTILIMGETGTGKELIARIIHNLSLRKEGPFIAINCAAIPDTLLESELFGYENGAFTGAKRSGKAGKFEMANGGTIFLDEIGDMPLHLQAKILRVLQERSVVRIGGSNSINLDIRVIAATHRNLEEKVKNNEFRMDLFYRLNVIPLFIPALRERKEDIVPLTKFFINKFSGSLGKNIEEVDEKFISTLLQYEWPGNVRELQNVLEFSINIESGNVLTKDSLPPRLRLYLCNKNLERKMLLKEKVDEFEKKLIIKGIEQCKSELYTVDKILEKLGISKATFYRKIKKFNIPFNDLR